MGRGISGLISRFASSDRSIICSIRRPRTIRSTSTPTVIAVSTIETVPTTRAGSTGRSRVRYSEPVARTARTAARIAKELPTPAAVPTTWVARFFGSSCTRWLISRWRITPRTHE